MKTLKNFLCEADINWIGSGFDESRSYQLISNPYYDKITPDNIRSQISDLVNNYKWDTRAMRWVKRAFTVNKESEIDAYIDDQLKTNINYSEYRYDSFDEYIKSQHDYYVNFGHDKSPHNWVKDENGDAMDINKWLNTTSQLSHKQKSWKEYYENEWERITKSKSSTIERLRRSLLDNMKYTIDVTEQMLRNIKLDSSCVFGAVAFHTGHIKKHVFGYVKMSGMSSKNKLVLEYTDNKAEALKWDTVGDLIDFLSSYKETKLLTESAGIGSKYGNSINISFDNNFKEGKMAVLKFKG